MTTYQEKKNNLIKEISKYIIEDNLISLANVVLISSEILKTNNFPIGKYKKWIKTNR